MVLPIGIGQPVNTGAVDRTHEPCDNYFTMSNSNKPLTMSEVIRRAIVEGGMSYKSVSRETGLTRASIQRFVDGRQSLRLDLADRLAEFFDLELRERG